MKHLEPCGDFNLKRDEVQKYENLSCPHCEAMKYM